VYLPGLTGSRTVVQSFDLDITNVLLMKRCATFGRACPLEAWPETFGRAPPVKSLLVVFLDSSVSFMLLGDPRGGGTKHVRLEVMASAFPRTDNSGAVGDCSFIDNDSALHNVYWVPLRGMPSANSLDNIIIHLSILPTLDSALGPCCLLIASPRVHSSAVPKRRSPMSPKPGLM
jgi:hypothetical protein